MHGLASFCHEAGNGGNNGRRCPNHARTVFLPDLDSFFWEGGYNLTKGYESLFKQVKKGGGDEENHYVGNGFSDDACIYWRVLGRVGCRWQGWKRWRT